MPPARVFIFFAVYPPVKLVGYCQSSLRDVCTSVSFAPSELVAFSPSHIHGLRRGLHSFAASRLGSSPASPASGNLGIPIRDTLYTCIYLHDTALASITLVT